MQSRYNFTLPAELIESAREWADANGVASISAVIRLALAAWLDRPELTKDRDEERLLAALSVPRKRAQKGKAK